MRHLKLTLEALAVESFDTSALEAGRGTVRALEDSHASDWSYVEDCTPMYSTPATCKLTCNDATCAYSCMTGPCDPTCQPLDQ